jgi:tetratricopeptide (TPR) repeat protein
MSNGAETLLRLGRYAEAIGPLEETLSRRKAQLGPDHSETLESCTFLAICYRSLGRLAEARKILEETVTVQKAKFGPDHPDTLDTMHALACTRFLLGQHTEALKLYDKTLAQRQAKLGVGHPDVLKSIREMAGFRLHSFAKTGDTAGCRAMVAMGEKPAPTDPAGCYDLACYRAVMAAVLRAGGNPSAATQADAEADRAMAWLTKAVAAGYKEVSQMKQNKDLDSLRARPDFQKLVADLDASAK